MNILELIKNEEVEWKKLGEVCELKRGKGLKKQDKGTGDIPAILYGELYTIYRDYITDIETKIDKKICESSVKVKKNSILLPISSTTKEAKIGKASVLKVDDVYLGSDAISLYPSYNVLSDYLMYIFNSIFFESKKMQNVSGTTIRHLSVSGILDITIPIPSLQTQEKIVETLDKFTKCVTELKSELKSRVKQYNYYRDKMLSEEYLNKMELGSDIVEYKKLGEIAKISSGGDAPKGRISKEKNEKFNIPIISNGIGENAIYGYTDIPIITNPSITISARGTIGYAEYRDYPFYPIVRVLSVESKDDDINMKYLYYSLQIKQYIIPNSNIKQLTIPMLKNEKVFIPPLYLQNKIVQILDKFQEYATDVEGLLPKEIELRQKQYEFYREKLLTFDENMVASKQARIISSNYYSLLIKAGKIVGIELNFGAEVKYKKLGEIGKISMCRRILKNQTQSIENIPFYKIGTFGGQADSYITKELFYEYKSKYPYPKKGEILISASGTIGRTAIYNGEDAYFQDSNIVWLSHDESQVMNKYLYYFYNTNPWKVSEGGTISRIYNSDIEKILIPLPSLHLQNKIVQILDKFQKYATDVKGLLPKEIELRQKQYEFYREKLLTFDKNVVTHTHHLIADEYYNLLIEASKIVDVVFVESKKLNEIVNILDSMRKPISKSQRVHGSYPYYGANGIKDYVNGYIFNGTYILIGEDGSVINSDNTPILHFVNGKIWVNNHAHVLQKKENFNLRYIYYALSVKDISNLVKGVPPKLNQSNLKEITIPIPSIAIQNYIVSILDSFQTYIADVEGLLPREIELRQKQYEYYREKLLNFRR